MRHDAGGVLMLPPFYYKGVSDDGLFASYAKVIERLRNAYPAVIAGVKDSSGDWENTKAMLERFQPQGFDVFVGSEASCWRICVVAAQAVSPRPAP